MTLLYSEEADSSEMIHSEMSYKSLFLVIYQYIWLTFKKFDENGVLKYVKSS